MIAGPVEATAIGNIAIQACADGELPSTLDGIRSGSAATTDLQTFEPK